MKNSRASERHPIALPIDVSLPNEAASSGKTRNISIGGAFIDLERTFAMGTRVVLKFKVPALTETIEVGAIVRWVESGGIGVQFDGLRARDVWALGKLFEKPPQG